MDNNNSVCENINVSSKGDNSSSQVNTQLEQKKLTNPCDKRVMVKLDLAIKLAGYREITAFVEKTKLSLDRTFISKVLHGHIKPTLDQAQVISNALGLRVQDIFDLSDLRDLDFFSTPSTQTKKTADESLAQPNYTKLVRDQELKKEGEDETA